MARYGPPRKRGPRRPPWRDRSARNFALFPGTKFQTTLAFTEAWVIDPSDFLVTQALVEVWQSTTTGSTQYSVTQAFVEAWLPVPPKASGAQPFLFVQT
jgi:hypothetical protein